MYPFRKTPRYTIINNNINISIGNLSIEHSQISTKIDNQDRVNQRRGGFMNHVNSAASIVTLASTAMSFLPMYSLSLMATPTTMMSSIFLRYNNNPLAYLKRRI